MARKSQEMPLGKYDNFPAIIHGEASLIYTSPLIKLQQAIILGFYNLNGFSEFCSMDMSNYNKTCDVEIGYETGVANGLFFNFLNTSQKTFLLNKLESGTPFLLLDFLVIVTYHYFDEGKKKPLKFDYFLLRFLFSRLRFKLQLFHEKGIQRVSPQELIKRLLVIIDREVKQLHLTPNRIEYIKTV